MSYFKPKDYIYSYQNESVAFDVNKETKDCYSIIIHTKLYFNGETKTRCEVVKNYMYPVLGKDNIKAEGKKYQETLLTAKIQECVDFIDNIIKAEGYWDKHPTKAFEKVFIEPTI